MGAAGIVNGLRKRKTDSRNKIDVLTAVLFTISMLILSIITYVEIGLSFLLLITIILFLIGVFMIKEGR
ncbi:hypothetical protein LG329_10015 [Virgibacillus necropolis]|uniref:hypothetical protein n=1 Tax=Virgibacillus necropolis TaxID=163877 RepID=UPI0038510D23